MELYIWKKNQPAFQKLSNPNELINSLLESHFNQHAIELSTPRLAEEKEAIEQFAPDAPPEDDKLYAVVVEANGIEIRKNMRLANAKVFLDSHNENGDMVIVEQKGKL